MPSLTMTVPTNGGKKAPLERAFLGVVYLRGKLIILEHFPELHLLNFACCSVWHFLDVLNIIWNPPLRNLAIQERLQLVWRDITLTVLHHNQEWALAPWDGYGQ